MNNFNLIAPFYDLIKKMVFRNKLSIAERYFLNRIEDRQQILVIGGGSGDLLNYLPPTCQIDYVEYAEKMIVNARKQEFDGDIEFIKGDFLETILNRKYDWIITNFFLDVFNEKHLGEACEKLYSLLKQDGNMIVTDFYPTDHLRGKILLKLMHVFFKLVSGLESKSLKNIPDFLLNSGFRNAEEHYWANRKIFSIIFQKMETFEKS